MIAKLAQRFNIREALQSKHSPVLVKLAQLFTKLAQLFNDHRRVIIKHSPLLNKLAQLFTIAGLLQACSRQASSKRHSRH